MIVRRAGYFNGATSGQEDAADAIVSEIQKAYVLGAYKIALNPDAVLAFLVSPVVGAALVPPSGAQATVAKNYEVLGGRIKKWRTTYRRWAEDGERADGSPYSWEQWKDFAKVLAGEVQYQTGVSWDASFLRALADTAAETYENITGGAVRVVTPSEWPWWAYAGVGLVGVVGAAYVVRTFTFR